MLDTVEALDLFIFQEVRQIRARSPHFSSRYPRLDRQRSFLASSISMS